MFGPRFSKFYLKIIPTPQLPFFLNTSADVAIKRAVRDRLVEDEHFFKKKEELYSRLNVKFIMIDPKTIEDDQKIIKQFVEDKIKQIKV